MTLIEVLMAVSFLTIGLVMMLTAVSRCLGVLKISEQYHKAMWALSAGETEFPLLQNVEPDAYAVDGQDYDGIRFERTVEDPDLKDGHEKDTRLLVLTTRLSWDARGREQVEEVTRYVLYQRQ